MAGKLRLFSVYSVAITALIVAVANGLLKRGQFCNVDRDCEEACCDRHRCAVVNDCGFKGELEQFY